MHPPLELLGPRDWAALDEDPEAIEGNSLQTDRPAVVIWESGQALIADIDQLQSHRR
jgi:hypothetical protein